MTARVLAALVCSLESGADAVVAGRPGRSRPACRSAVV